MKYTIELKDAEREVICNIIRTIRDNSLGEHRLFENTTLFKFDEESSDYSAVYRKGVADGNNIADKDLKEIQDSTYDIAYNKGVEAFGHLFVFEHDYEQFFEDTYGSKAPDYNLYDLVAEYGAKKVLDDFKKWQEEKNKAEEEIIKGDTVCFKSSPNSTFIVWDILDEGDEGIFVYGFNQKGTYSSVNIKNVKKVNVPNCYSEVSQLLDKMRGEEK